MTHLEPHISMSPVPQYLSQVTTTSITNVIHQNTNTIRKGFMKIDISLTQGPPARIKGMLQ